MPSSIVLKSWHTCAHSHPNRCSKWTHLQLKKSHILQIMMKISCMPIACFIFWLFMVSAFWLFMVHTFILSSYIMINMCIFISKQGFKKWSYFTKNCSFWSLIFKMKVGCMPIAGFILWLFTINALFLYSWVVAYTFKMDTWLAKKNCQTLLRNVFFEP